MNTGLPCARMRVPLCVHLCFRGVNRVQCVPALGTGVEGKCVSRYILAFVHRCARRVSRGGVGRGRQAEVRSSGSGRAVRGGAAARLRGRGPLPQRRGAALARRTPSAEEATAPPPAAPPSPPPPSSQRRWNRHRRRGGAESPENQVVGGGQGPRPCTDTPAQTPRRPRPGGGPAACCRWSRPWPSSPLRWKTCASWARLPPPGSPPGAAALTLRSSERPR